MLHRLKHFLILISVFILTACSTDNGSVENEPSHSVEEETNTVSEETTSETNENQKEDSTEEENESVNESATEETSTVGETSDFQGIYDELVGKSFIFSSGAGAWRTAFTFTNNGQFSGTFSYANGPEVFVSEFSGQFNIIDQIDEYTYQLELDQLQVTSDTGTEEVDGEMTINYVDEPHGFQSGSNTFELYLPYKPKNEVSEEYLSWVYGQANNEHDFFNSFGLYNVTHEFGMEELFD